MTSETLSKSCRCKWLALPHWNKYSKVFVFEDSRGIAWHQGTLGAVLHQTIFELSCEGSREGRGSNQKQRILVVGSFFTSLEADSGAAVLELTSGGLRLCGKSPTGKGTLPFLSSSVDKSLSLLEEPLSYDVVQSTNWAGRS